MQQDYMFWKFHGEKEFSHIPEQVTGKEPIQVKDNQLTYLRLNDFINDTYKVHAMQPTKLHKVEVLYEEGNDRDYGEGAAAYVDTRVPHENDYILLRAAATRPLYPNCQ